MGAGGTQINKDFSHSLYKDELRVASGTKGVFLIIVLNNSVLLHTLTSPCVFLNTPLQVCLYLLFLSHELPSHCYEVVEVYS